METSLKKLKSELDYLKLENDNSKLKILATKMLNELSYSLIDSFKKTQNELQFTKSNKIRTKGIKLNSWWDKTIQKLHNELVQCYIRYRDSDYSIDLKKDYTEAKSNFRARKRYNIKFKRDKNLK